MKMRNDFVSNSSSSSFIVISKMGKDQTNDIKYDFRNQHIYVVPNDNYKHKFGWEHVITSSFEDKLNFVGLQLLYLLEMKIGNLIYKPEPNQYVWHSRYEDKFDEYYLMTKKVCREKFGFEIELNKDLLNIVTHVRNEGSNESIAHYISMNYEFYIDHQSCISENSCAEMFESEDAMYDFLRTEDSYIQGGNDNE